MSKINGLDVVLKVSTDGVTYKSFICEISSGLDLSRNSNQVETKCDNGVAYTTLGALTGTIPFSGVLETTVSATQVSANEMLGFFNSKTYIYWKIENPSGGALMYRSGNGYITSYSESYNVGELVQCEGEISIDGAIDLTA
jgi:hypothetical protein